MSTSTAKAYGAKSASADLAPLTIERRAPLEDDVSIKILYCGVCHSDLHGTRNDWGDSTYPVIPGHEIVGKVTAVGSKVTKFKVGDLVGVGWMSDACLSCKECKVDFEQFCDEMIGTFNSEDKHFKDQKTYGGFSEAIVIKEHFVLRMPDNLDPAEAAPLLCAGITMYSPLVHWKVTKGTKVGIVGLGGLGHMGLKFAHAMGAEVTLFSTSEGKEEEAKALGADKVVISKDEKQMEDLAGYFDVIIDTIPVQHEVSPYVKCVVRDGAFVVVGLVGEIGEKLHTSSLMFKRRTFSGSVVGGIKETQEMLDFCAKHKIVSEIEKIAIKDINTAFKRMEDGDVRFRFVIDVSTL